MMNRRNFLKSVVAAAVLPLLGDFVVPDSLKLLDWDKQTCDILGDIAKLQERMLQSFAPPYRYFMNERTAGFILEKHPDFHKNNNGFTVCEPGDWFQDGVVYATTADN
jgi:hypothetical protein